MQEPGRSSPAPERAAEEGGESASTVLVPPPWWLTLDTAGGEGVRVASMDIRSFTAPLVEPGDVLLAVNGVPGQSPEEMARGLLAILPGELVMLTIRNEDQSLEYVLLQVPEREPEAEALRGRGR